MSGAARQTLDETDLHADPFQQLRGWLADAEVARVYQPDAMTLATATPEGRPSARLVLLRGLDDRGLTFFTNYDSRKAGELTANPWAALVLFWAELHRQVRVEGRVEVVSAAESDAYFRSRPRGSQISAWASPQSQVVADREVLERAARELAGRFGEGPVPRPPRWGGFRVVPDRFEFWQGRENRLHDRLCYRRRPEGGWQVVRLAP